MIFSIPRFRLDDFLKDIAKLNRRAVKMGIPAIVVTEGRHWLFTYKQAAEARHMAGQEIAEWMVDVNVEGQVIRFDGWIFVASVDHLGKKEDGTFVNVINQAPYLVNEGLNVPEIPVHYRSIAPTCEHCHAKHQRTHTYLVWKEGEGFKMVGTTCVQSFLGVSPFVIAARATWLRDFSELDSYEDMGGFGGQAAKMFSTHGFLSIVSALIRLYGWCSRSNSGNGVAATADIALDIFFDKDKEIETDETDRLKATQTIAWMRENLAQKTNLTGFESNLVAVFSEDYFLQKHAGLIAFGLVMWERESKTTQTPVDTRVSEWQGTVKQRTEWELTCDVVISISSLYGISYLHKFQDKDGNVFSWFSSSACLEEGKTYKGKATVKDHSLYKGVKETQLTRCDFKEVITEGTEDIKTEGEGE
jgi:hypothetical protein